MFAATFLFFISLIYSSDFATSSETSLLTEFISNNLCEAKEPNGTIGDCCCEYSTVDSAINSFYVPVLKKITESKYFRYFRVDLEGECPFWNAPNQCSMENCAVCPCGDAELSQNWTVESLLDVDKHRANTSLIDSDIYIDTGLHNWCMQHLQQDAANEPCKCI